MARCVSFSAAPSWHDVARREALSVRPYHQVLPTPAAVDVGCFPVDISRDRTVRGAREIAPVAPNASPLVRLSRVDMRIIYTTITNIFLICCSWLKY